MTSTSAGLSIYTQLTLKISQMAKFTAGIVGDVCVDCFLSEVVSSILTFDYE